MAPALGRSPTATNRRRRIWGAIVFTDIVGFTEFTAVEGDEQALELLRTQEQLVNDVLPTDARVVKELGDGLLLWFPDAPARSTRRCDCNRASRTRRRPACRCGCAWECTAAKPS